MSDRVLVTGANGFVGRRLVERLRLKGLDVLAPGRDVLDIALDIFPDVGVDQVIHLAARTFVPDSWLDPASFYRVNAQGTVNVADYCRRVGARLLHISAYCYGLPLTLPISESAPLNPNNAYAFSKCAAEYACQFYAKHFGVHVTILRPFNLYGPGQGSHFLIPKIIEQALEPTVAQIVVEDSTPRRDYIHVDDLIGAICAARIAPQSGGVYNVGYGQSHSVAEIVEFVCRLAAINKPVVNRGIRRANEIPDVVADIAAIRRDLGWSPSISLTEGLMDLIARWRSDASGALVKIAASLDVLKPGDDRR